MTTFQLTSLDGKGPDRPASLSAGVRLGRHPRCEVTLDDASISRVHARVVEQDGELVLVDADSRNGIRVGGRRVARVRLETGVELAIGRLEFKVEASAADAVTPAPAAVEDPIDEDLDFADDFDLDAPAAEDLAAEDLAADELAADEGGFELEDPAEIELPRASAAPSSPAPSSPAPSSPAPTSPAPTRPAPAAPEPPAAGEEPGPDRRAAMLAEVADERRGLLRGDLTQYPGWVQGLIWLLALGLFGALVVGMVRLFRG